MDLITVKQLYRQREDYFGKSVSVGGWVRSNRDSKNFGFLVINDGTYFETLQVVYTDALALVNEPYITLKPGEFAGLVEDL